MNLVGVNVRYLPCRRLSVSAMLLGGVKEGHLDLILLFQDFIIFFILSCVVQNRIRIRIYFESLYVYFGLFPRCLSV